MIPRITVTAILIISDCRKRINTAKALISVVAGLVDLSNFMRKSENKFFTSSRDV